MQKKISKVFLGILALSIIMMSALVVGCADDSAAEAKAAMEAKKTEAAEPAQEKKSVPENLTKALPDAKYVMRMAYTDAGATAADVCDGDLTAGIVVDNPVDTSVAGNYVIRYNVSDSASNAADEVTRTVTVEDTVVPTLTLEGDVSVTVECGDTYTDAGATAADACDGINFCCR